jgi:hypothetical protein
VGDTRRALADRAVVALAVIGALGVAAVAWALGWQAGSVLEEAQFSAELTAENLWILRVEAVSTFVVGPATLAAIGGCLGILILVAARLRALDRHPGADG